MSKQKPSWLGHTDNAEDTRNHGQRRLASFREKSRERTLAAWLGPERATAVIASLRPETPSFQQVLEQQLERCRGKEVCFLDKIRAVWPELVGNDCALVSYPAYLDGNILVVEVKDNTWLYVLERQKRQEITATVLARFPDQGLQSLKFVLQGRYCRR